MMIFVKSTSDFWRDMAAGGMAIIGMSLFPAFACADSSFETADGVEIESAHATPAPKGGTMIVRFRVVNLSVNNIALVGVRSSIAGVGAMVMRDPLMGTRDVTTLTIEREEELGFNTSKIWTELRDTKEGFVEGDYIPFELLFRHGTVATEAHVHKSAVRELASW